MAWQLAGQYFETCSCTVLCPCILSQATAVPTEGYCDAVLAFHIERGGDDGLDLAGLTAVVALHTDGPMANGQGRRAVILDQRASDTQRQALERIFTGQVGGPPEALVGLVPELVGVETAAIAFELAGDARSLRVDGFGEQTVTALPGMGGEPLQLTHTGHPANDDLAVARAGDTARFKGASFDIDNAGKNGHFAPFSWSAG
jgi:hypothetical protein